MTELIKVTDGAVSARDLHRFLVVEANGGQKGKQFNHWIKNMMEYDFELGVDYITIGYNYLGEIVEENGVAKKGQSDNQYVSKRDYILTISTAKEIAMLQRNDRGKLARQYFIECEKKLKEQQSSKLMTTEEMIIAQAKSVIEVKHRVTKLEDKVKELNARTATRPDFFTVVGYATINGLPKFGLREAQSIGKKAAAMAKEEGVRLDSCPDPRFGRVKMYPSSILKRAFSLVIPQEKAEA